MSCVSSVNLHKELTKNNIPSEKLVYKFQSTKYLLMDLYIILEDGWRVNKLDSLMPDDDHRFW